MIAWWFPGAEGPPSGHPTVVLLEVVETHGIQVSGVAKVPRIDATVVWTIGLAVFPRIFFSISSS